jgi:hypothetical protein
MSQPVFHINRLGYILLLSVVLFSFSSSIESNSWELIREKEGIKVYTREMPGKDIKALKMSGEIEGQSLSSFVALFQDLSSYDKWVYSSSDTKLLKRLSDNEIYYYVKSEFPWPFSDRDFVIYNKIWQDKDTKAFYSHSKVLNDYLEEKEDVVRVKEFESTWKITPLKNGNYSLHYTFNSDPGGYIPSWLINSFLDVGPFKTIKGMEKAAADSKYKDVKFSFLEDLNIEN